ncbi:MAG: phosphatidate cytidylyltransferase [Streptosporangiales bacterium]|nr:phosphatidate cytidylyltransferase [Streptosporangiales bacterium]
MDRESEDAELDGSSHAAEGAGGAPAVEPTGKTRKGRNFAAGAGVGVLFGVVVLLVLYFAKPVFVILIAGFGGIGVWEFTHALRLRGITIPLVPLLGIVVANVAAAYVFGLAGIAMATAVGVLLVLTWRLRDGVDGYIRDATGAVCVAVYVPVLMAFVSLLLHPADGAHRVVVFIAVVFASDTGGLLLGSLIGRHQMTPVISPKKSWEGLTGSLLGAAGLGAWLVSWLLDAPWWVGVILGVVVAVVGTVGDLVVSAIKRDLGVKDMSSLIPGHGGMMDRLDSITAAAPAVWATLVLLVPPS